MRRLSARLQEPVDSPEDNGHLLAPSYQYSCPGEYGTRRSSPTGLSIKKTGDESEIVRPEVLKPEPEVKSELELELASAEASHQQDEPSQQQQKNQAQQSASTTTLISLFVGLGFATICTGLDRAILATAIPKITTEFDSIADVGWYGSAYLMTLCGFQLLFGKLYAELNVKWVFMVSLLIFEVGSVVCAAAPSSTVMIVGRAVAGVGGCGLISGSLIITAIALPLHQRPIFMGLFGGLNGVSQAVAPTLGGVLTDKAGWRWCFWINLPLGVVALLCIVFFIKLPPNHSPVSNNTKWSFRVFMRRLDLIGTVLLLAWVICLLLALQWGGAQYPWNEWRIILLLVFFVVLLLAWLFSQYVQKDKATLPFRLLKVRSLAFGSVFIFCIFSSAFIVTYYVPIWFQSVRGMSASASGVDLLAFTVALFITVISSGIIVSRIGYYIPNMVVSVISTAVGNGLLYTFDINTNTATWVLALVIVGFGVGSGLQQPFVAVQTSLEGADMALGVSVIVFLQSLSGTVMLAAAESIFQSTTLSELRQKAPGVDAQYILSLGASDLKHAVQAKYPQEVEAVLIAYNLGIRQVFLMSLILSCLTVLVLPGFEWKKINQPQKKAEKS